MSYFDCKELQEDIELYFDNLKVIGTGAFGTVYSADTTLKAYEEIGVDLPSTIALKELSIYAEGREELLHEIQIIKRLDNPWTMKYYGCFESNSLLYIVTELVPGKDLYDCISDRLVTLDQKDIIVSKLAQAITNLHSIGFIHRDLKLENIMFDTQTNSLKLIDYGLACLHSTAPSIGKCDNFVGTPGYFDPVLINPDNRKLNNLILSDWWSYGQIVFIVYTGFQLWDVSKGSRGRYYSYTDMVSDDPSIANDIPLRFRHILSELTNPNLDQSERPSPHEILTVFTSAKTLVQP